MRILFVGETIIDEYRYVGPLAKPSKEFTLATVETKPPERFLGGVQAAALHGDWKNVTVVTDDGEPIKKTRYVDDAFTRKLFEVYSKPRIEMSGQRREDFGRKVFEWLMASDVAIVMDFGHGLLDEWQRAQIAAYPKFLAVNAQTNAGNYGFNPVTKYSRADLVCIDVPEAQLAAGEQHQLDAFSLAAGVTGNGINTDALIITQGRNGSTACLDTRQYHIPAFTPHATDTIGAGDAFLAIAAPLVAAGLDLEQAAFCGNVAGAIKTDIVGHRRHVTRQELIDRIGELLSSEPRLPGKDVACLQCGVPLRDCRCAA